MNKKKVSFISPQDKARQAELWIQNEQQQKAQDQENSSNDYTEKRKNENAITHKNVNHDEHINDYQDFIKHENTKNLDKIDDQEMEKNKRLTIDVPASLHKAFKKTAVMNDDIMSDLLRYWIEEYVKKHNGSR